MPIETTTAALDIETLKKQHRDLDTQRTKAKANLETAQKQLDELKDEARKGYGTDDLGELKIKLQEMKSENERKRADYQSHLEQIRGKLDDVEKNFPAAQGSRAG